MAAPTQGQPDSSREFAPAPDTTERDRARAEELALAVAAKEGCMESFEQLVARLERPVVRFSLPKNLRSSYLRRICCNPLL